MKRSGLWACLIILLGNLAALAGVAWNHSGEASSRMTLTQRELYPSHDRHRENSSVQLRLLWQKGAKSSDCEKLYPFSTDEIPLEEMAALGFDVPAQLNEETAWRYDRQLPRQVLLVLEFDGEKYQSQLAWAQRCLAQAEQTLSDAPGNSQLQEQVQYRQRELTELQTQRTRLYLTATGLDVKTLRDRFPDHERYLIIPAVVSPSAYSPVEGEWLAGGTVQNSLGRQAINVPHQWRSTLADTLNDDSLKSPKFEVDIAFGKRLEPWIEDLRLKPEH